MKFNLVKHFSLHQPAFYVLLSFLRLSPHALKQKVNDILATKLGNPWEQSENKFESGILTILRYFRFSSSSWIFVHPPYCHRFPLKWKCHYPKRETSKTRGHRMISLSLFILRPITQEIANRTPLYSFPALEIAVVAHGLVLCVIRKLGGKVEALPKREFDDGIINVIDSIRLGLSAKARFSANCWCRVLCHVTSPLMYV